MSARPFDTVLVANRGEIARRVIRTLRALGIRSVAVYSDADATAPHVREADVAVRIGPAAASASYLDIDAVIRAARQTGAQAIHPGYGFLSENAAFAAACADAGIVFVGPGEEALAVMGDKIRAREHVAAHGVPIVAGRAVTALDGAALTAAGAEVGFPLLVKPSAGGGGKGMQIVERADALPDAVAGARRVAAAAFGDDGILLERLVAQPRHIEVQVLADTHGTTVHLGERECSLQRRHQKVIEEAPSPAIDAETRARLGVAACAAAESVGYVGAGTVEFLVSAHRPEEFFFIEMNTRLQVEHAVTELVTGIDLVAEQLRIAAGLPLSFGQDDVRLDGWAIEARVYAESPARGFLPATGDVLAWDSPADVRVDAAVERGSTVTADYDPMIAKVVAHGPDRAIALRRLDAALADTVVLGVDTNIAFLRELLAVPEVVAGDLHTGIIERMPPTGNATASPAALRAAAAVAAADPRGRLDTAAARADADLAAASPLWRAPDGWRLAGVRAVPAVTFLDESGDLVTAARAASGDDTRGATVARDADGDVWVHADGGTMRLRPLGRRAAHEVRLASRSRDASVAPPEVRAPMPGAVLAVHVADGDRVASGDRLVTIEAMKMEHPVTAPHAGVVRMLAAAGAQVRRDEVLAEVRAHEPVRQTHEEGRP